MRPLSFHSHELRALLLRNQIATLDELKQALGTAVDVTVSRKLKSLDYLTSYSHRGRYYIDRVGIVGGGLFPRTALIVEQLLPSARVTIIDASPVRQCCFIFGI